MTLTGELVLGGSRIATDDTFTAINPATGDALEPGFSQATTAHVDQACALAWSAFDAFRETDLEARAAFFGNYRG